VGEGVWVGVGVSGVGRGCERVWVWVKQLVEGGGQRLNAF
jgi:hypothetical protein